MGSGARFLDPLDPLGFNRGRNVKDQLLDPLNLSRSYKAMMTPAAAPVNAAGYSTMASTINAASQKAAATLATQQQQARRTARNQAVATTDSDSSYNPLR